MKRLPHRLFTPAPRAVLRALLVAAAAAALACPAARRVIAGQQPQNSGINFVFEIDEYRGVDERGGYVEIEVRNALDDGEPARTLNLAFSKPGYADENDTRLEGRGRVDLAATRRLLIYPEPEDWRWRETASSQPRLLIFTDVNWPGAEAAEVSAGLKEAGVVVSALALPLPAGKYQVVVYVNNAYGPKNQEPVVDIGVEVRAGRKFTVPVKSPTLFESMLARLGNRESLLISIIVGLSALVVAALKDKIKEAANRALDGLGKFGSGKLAERRFRRKYLGVVADRHKHLRLVGLHSAGVSRPLLEEVFVSLRISGHGQPGGAAAASIPFAAALAQYPRMVILGAPGAGKTTTLSYALLTFANGRQAERFGISRRLLPVFVPLRRLRGGGRSITEDLADPETQILPQDLLKDLPKRYFENRLSRGQCLVLLDGLDEVVDEKTYREVADKINDLAAAYPDNRFVVTCRVAGWRSYLSGEFAVLQTQDFSRDEIQRFVLGWYRAVITQAEYSRLYFDKPDRKEFERAWATHYEEKVRPAIESKSRNLLNQIDSNNRILSIAVNPMLLSLTCLVHSVRNILPRGRTILYSQCLELLIDSWERSKDIAWHQTDRTTPNQKEAVLREIAFDFQARGRGEDARGNIEALIGAISKRLGIAVPAGELLEEIELRSGLLIERSIGVFGFSHLTLQEYLVAKHVLLNPAYVELLLQNIGKQEWREVLLLYSGLLDDATALVEKILGQGEGGEFAALVLAGRCIGDSQNCDPAVAERVIEGLLGYLYRRGAFREEAVGALAALAVDFRGEPKTPREGLVTTLRRVANGRPLYADSPPPDEQLRGDCITILGLAKATAALEAIVELLFDRDATIQEAAADALVSFGNLALDHLSRSLSRADALAAPFIFTDYADIATTLESALTYTDAHHARAVNAYIDVLRRINTGSSAKLLLNLYEVSRGPTRRSVALALARMLNNHFIEIDLQQMRKESLPAGLRYVEGEDNAWPRGGLPPGSGFPVLENHIINDLADNLGRARAGSPALRADREDAAAAPFKLMFPALLKHIKRAGAGERGQKFVVIPDELWAWLGFGERPETPRLNLLATQICKGYSTPLSDSLRNAGVTRADSADAPRKTLVSATVLLSNIYFTGYMGWCALMLIVFALILYNDWRTIPKIDAAYFFAAIGLSLLSYSSLVFVTQSKLRRRPFSRDALGTLAFPVSNALKVFRNSVTSRRWLKFLGLQVPLHLLNPGFIAFLIFFLTDGFPTRTSAGIIFIGVQLVLALLSASYLKFYLLASNPTLQLLLAHPEGAKLVRSS